MLERFTNMKEEFIIGASHNRKGNLDYGDCSKYLAYSIDSRVVGFRILASVVESFLDKPLTLGYREKSMVGCIRSKSTGC